MSGDDTFFHLGNRVLVRIGGITFQTKDGVMTDYLRYLVQLRKKIGKKTPMGWGLKILANALIGAMGSFSLPICSPRVSAAVPMIGRQFNAIIAVAFGIVGMTRVYGDTDSGFFVQKGWAGAVPHSLPYWRQ